MRGTSTLLLAGIFLTGIGVSAARAENLLPDLKLSPKDPKYNSAACRSLRAKAQNYNETVFNQSPESYVFAAILPGGSLGLAAVVNRKREMFKAKVEQACMTHPPDRSYLDPAGSGKE